MSIIDEFELVKNNHKDMFITLRNRTVTFSKECAVALSNAEYVHAFVDRRTSRFLIVPSENDSDAMPFYREPNSGKQLLMRWASKEKSELLMDMAGLDDCGKGVRFYGSYVPEDDAIVFNLK